MTIYSRGRRAESPLSSFGHAAGSAAHVPSLVLRDTASLGRDPGPLRQEVPSPPVDNAFTVPNLLIGERDRRLYVLGPEKIDYIEAEGNYVKFHVGATNYIARDSIKKLAATMADNGFVRIERSLLLNVRAIAFVQRAGRGTYSFTLQSGACLHSGAKFRDQILRVLPLA